MLRTADAMKLMDGMNFVIATDFDDTLVYTKKYPEIGKPTQWFHQLKDLQKRYPNLQTILWTCRADKPLEDAVKFCKGNGLKIDAVNEDVESSLQWKGKTPKPFAHIYVDDRAVCAERDIGEIYNMLVKYNMSVKYGNK